MAELLFTSKFEKGAFWPGGNHPAPTLLRQDNGELIRERIPCKRYEPMIDPAGHVVNLTYNHCSSIRTLETAEALQTRYQALSQKWVPYRECPLHYTPLRREVPAEVLEKAPAPCPEHTDTGGGSRPRADRGPCVHAAAIEAARKAKTAAAHSKALAPFQNSSQEALAEAIKHVATIAGSMAGATDRKRRDGQ